MKRNLHNKGLCLTLTALSILILTGGYRVLADESPFGYIYSADMPHKGDWEYEQWNTVRTGKAAGSYTSFDLRNEIEYGVTDNFSAAFYLNSSYLYSNDVPNPDDASTMIVNQNNFDINGVSLELQMRLLDPDKDPFGLVLYLEPELGVRSPLTGEDVIERGVEFKVILQKDFFQNRLMLASNLTVEPEWEKVDGDQEKELKTEGSLGAAYHFQPAWSAGLELLSRRTFEGQNFSKQIASAVFLGPSVHYENKSWWATFTVLPQITGHPRNLGADTAGNPVSDPFRTLGEYEKMEFRLRFGFEFS